MFFKSKTTKALEELDFIVRTLVGNHRHFDYAGRVIFNSPYMLSFVIGYIDFHLKSYSEELNKPELRALPRRVFSNVFTEFSEASVSERGTFNFANHNTETHLGYSRGFVFAAVGLNQVPVLQLEGYQEAIQRSEQFNRFRELLDLSGNKRNPDDLVTVAYKGFLLLWFHDYLSPLMEEHILKVGFNPIAGKAG